MEGSKVAQLARAEAEQAEADNDDTAEEEAAENEQPSEPVAAESEPEAKKPTDKQIERKLDVAGKAAKKHAEGFAEMLGADPETLVPCACCDIPGFWFAGRGPLEPEREQAVRAAIGEADVRDLEPAAGVVECETCRGRGELRRPTRVPSQIVAVCPTCNGFGWHGEQQQQQFAPPPQPEYVLQAANGPGTSWTPPPPPGMTPTNYGG